MHCCFTNSCGSSSIFLLIHLNDNFIYLSQDGTKCSYLSRISCLGQRPVYRKICEQSIKLQFLTSQKFRNNPVIISCFLFWHENACCSSMTIRGLTYILLWARVNINIVYKTILSERNVYCCQEPPSVFKSSTDVFIYSILCQQSSPMSILWAMINRDSCARIVR